MNIQEILDRVKNLKSKCNYCLKIGENMYIPRYDKQTDDLLETICLIDDMVYCITNLQEENKQLTNARYSLDRIDKAIEYKRQLLFDLNKQYITFEKWEEILEPFENILKGEDKE